MKISDVAGQTGTPISTIRYYEKRAIIPKPNRSGRDRTYTQKDVSAIQFVRDAQSLGLTLNEIATLVHGPWSRGEMANLASAHRQSVREKITSLKRIDRVLSTLEACHCDSFVECDMNAAKCKRDD